MTKLAPVSDFMIVCTRTQMIVKGLLDQSMLIQLLNDVEDVEDGFMLLS